MRVTPEDIQHLEEEIKRAGQAEKALAPIIKMGLLTFQKN